MSNENEKSLFEQGITDDHDEAFIEMAGRLPGEAKVQGEPTKPGLIIAMGAYEREIHHFHVFRSREDNRAWSNGACLCLNENRYCGHGRNTEILTEDELKAVVEKLRQRHPVLGISNWKYLVTLWNDNNDRYPVDPELPMPNYDYETITRCKEGVGNIGESVESNDDLSGTLIE